MERRTFLKTTSLAAGSMVARHSIHLDEEKIKLGIVGTGWWGRDFITHYALQSNQFDIIGICDVNQKAIELELAKIAASGMKKPQVFTNYQELYDMSDLQAVAIVTPTHWHALQFIAACEKGLDIWQEKPISYDIREAQAMEKAYQKAGNVVNIDFPRIWGPSNGEIKDYIQSGQLGEIRHIQFNIHNPTGTAPAAEVPKAIDYEEFCGPAPLLPYTSGPNGIGPAWRGQHGFSRGILVDWGIHFVQNVREVMDLHLPDSISSISYSTNPNNEHPNQQEILLDFGGLPVQWSHKGWGYVSPAPHTNIGIFYHGSKGTIFSTDIGWEVYPGDGSSIKEYGKPKAQYGGPDYQAGVDLVFDAQFRAFAQAIREKSNAPIKGTFDEGFSATAAVNFADLAIRTGKQVTIDKKSLGVIDNPAAKVQLLRNYRGTFKHPYLS